jgi:hypothetical protein
VSTALHLPRRHKCVSGKQEVVKLFIVGTDHRLQQTIAPKAGGGWIQRTGGRKFLRGITYFLTSLGVKAICEEAHARQEEIAPTICSALAKQYKLPWICIADSSSPDLEDGLIDFSTFPPEVIAGRYRLDMQGQREENMCSIIRQTLEQSETVLAVVGFTHAAVLARQFEKEQIPVEVFQMTYGLILDESQT